MGGEFENRTTYQTLKCSSQQVEKNISLSTSRKKHFPLAGIRNGGFDYGISHINTISTNQIHLVTPSKNVQVILHRTHPLSSISFCTN
jgi:hypothetical protein